MSTRAMYTFRDETGEYHVYKHSDGYPTGAAQWIEAALPFAWTFPRFEADEFAAAFVAANKSHWHNREFAALKELAAVYEGEGTHAGQINELRETIAQCRRYAEYNGGGVRLMNSGSVYAVAPGDIEYRYDVTCNKAGKLQVKAFSTSFWDVCSKKNEKRIFQGSLAGFKDAAAELERPGGCGAGRITIGRHVRGVGEFNASLDGRVVACAFLYTDGKFAVHDIVRGGSPRTADDAEQAHDLMLAIAKREAAIADLERPGGCGAQRLGVYWTARSTNKKTGPIPVSTTSSETCPSACPLAKGGCYAKGGNVGILWHALTRHGPNAAWAHGAAMARSIDWAGLCERVGALAPGTLWRHNQAGDLPHKGQKITFRAFRALVNANKGRRGFTYTHHDVLGAGGKHNRLLVRWANSLGFTVNLSANDLTHADRLADTGAGPVVVILPSGAPREVMTPAGRSVKVCPAVLQSSITCSTCQWCARPQRSWIVGFPAHGSQRSAASAIAQSV
jgi:hypothetical protein